MPRPILHVSHHKCLTVFFARILSSVAELRGVPMMRGKGYDPSLPIQLSWNGKFDPATVRPQTRVTHILRDPRDLLVSGWHYHLWTEEPWANQPRQKYGGRSYREVLSRLSKDEGLELEIEMLGPTLESMLRWHSSRAEQLLHLRYEDVFGDEVEALLPTLLHWQLSRLERDRSIRCIRQNSFRAKRARGQVGAQRHARRGTPGDWKNHLEPCHLELIEQLYPGVLAQLGYVAESTAFPPPPRHEPSPRPASSSPRDRLATTRADYHSATHRS